MKAKNSYSNFFMILFHEILMNGPAVQVTAAFIIPERDHFWRNNVIFCLRFTHTIGKNPQTRAKYKIWEDNMLV